MIVSLRRNVLRPVRVAWRARRVQRTQQTEAKEVRRSVGFFQSFQEMLEHQAELMIRSFDR